LLDVREIARSLGAAMRLAAMASAMIAPPPAGAVDLQDLVSPGPLIAAHQREAKDCNACHKRFDRGAQRDLCFKCHEPVGQDIAAGTGFHGHLGEGTSLTCRTCHAEHQGAEADILGLVPESFDHDRSDFPLRGGHAVTACSACHEAGEPHRKAPDTCLACHGKQDPHEGRLGEACQDCHEPAGWKSIRFDHAKTRFPLEGRHAEASCELCHPKQHFRDTPRTCVTCHRVDDVHRGRLGDECQDCHDARSFEKSPFDHGSRTRFALKGRHAELACKECHESDPKTEKLAMDCAACHAPDDDHLGRRGPQCERCHGVRSWKTVAFDHQRDTKFALRGSHERLACDLCHLKKLYAETTPTRCAACHAAADVHEGSLGGDCARCHRESA